MILTSIKNAKTEDLRKDMNKLQILISTKHRKAKKARDFILSIMNIIRSELIERGLQNE